MPVQHEAIRHMVVVGQNYPLLALAVEGHRGLKTICQNLERFSSLPSSAVTYFVQDLKKQEEWGRAVRMQRLVKTSSTPRWLLDCYVQTAHTSVLGEPVAFLTRRCKTDQGAHISRFLSAQPAWQPSSSRRIYLVVTRRARGSSYSTRFVCERPAPGYHALRPWSSSVIELAASELPKNAERAEAAYERARARRDEGIRLEGGRVSSEVERKTAGAGYRGQSREENKRRATV
ncbi:hypothetical protein OH76DRAFT_1516396 [Lentinus brumalis]|uniref:Uncharacterized protein n=1 Tax=Lentinus brumalis TaxID=2498619 RepID=A0A371CHJ5_9APHY|nr:hypothetical protein OH76DRAFT_1516396 [Polyporus brumalis]